MSTLILGYVTVSLVLIFGMLFTSGVYHDSLVRTRQDVS